VAPRTETDGRHQERDDPETTDPTHAKATVADVWAREHAAQLFEIVERALSYEGLSEEEVAFCCWSGDGVVLGLPSGDGAVAVYVADEGPRRVGFVKLVIVDSSV
jgi:hypothetical protein